jgi:hypothetical protein
LPGFGVLPKTLFDCGGERSAEDEVLCRGSGPAHLGDATADSRKTPFSFAAAGGMKRVVEKLPLGISIRTLIHRPEDK